MAASGRPQRGGRMLPGENPLYVATLRMPAPSPLNSATAPRNHFGPAVASCEQADLRPCRIG